MTSLLRKSDFEEIVSLLRNGEIVAFPTDTVFGIGVISNNPEAVEKMKTAKGRDGSKPFPLMVADTAQMDTIAYLSDREKMISLSYMPGALTMVVNRRDTVKKELVNGFDTVAIRIPDDEFVLSVLKAVGPMFVTSANNSGEPAANTHLEALAQLLALLVAYGEKGELTCVVVLVALLLLQRAVDECQLAVVEGVVARSEGLPEAALRRILMRRTTGHCQYNGQEG